MKPQLTIISGLNLHYIHFESVQTRQIHVKPLNNFITDPEV